MLPNTLFLRLEGPLQAWGSHESKLAVRRTLGMPTKSAVAGLLCAALGIPRESCAEHWLPIIAQLSMGVRIDRAGVRWWDYHTVGAGQQVPIAEYPEKKLEDQIRYPSPEEAAAVKKSKAGAMLSRREYLCDASFLVALQGSSNTIEALYAALCNPKWQIFLGRKCCVPSRPINEHGVGSFDSIVQALASIPLASMSNAEDDNVDIWVDWSPASENDDLPDEAEVLFDVPLSFSPNVYQPRYVVSLKLPASTLGTDMTAYPKKAWRPSRPNADYRNSEYQKRRAQRLIMDHGLCVFCKTPATTVQHISYAHAGGDERLDELRSMCRLCHDAATMLEYGAQMGMYRIDPCDAAWRDKLLAKRQEIVRFRSREKRSEAMQRGKKEE